MKHCACFKTIPPYFLELTTPSLHRVAQKASSIESCLFRFCSSLGQSKKAGFDTCLCPVVALKPVHLEPISQVKTPSRLGDHKVI